MHEDKDYLMAKSFLAKAKTKRDIKQVSMLMRRIEIRRRNAWRDTFMDLCNKYPPKHWVVRRTKKKSKVSFFDL